MFLVFSYILSVNLAAAVLKLNRVPSCLSALTLAHASLVRASLAHASLVRASSARASLVRVSFVGSSLVRSLKMATYVRSQSTAACRHLATENCVDDTETDKRKLWPSRLVASCTLWPSDKKTYSGTCSQNPLYRRSDVKRF